MQILNKLLTWGALVAFLASCGGGEIETVIDPCDRTVDLPLEANLEFPNNGVHSVILFTETIGAVVNTSRCKSGLLELESDLTLNIVAEAHVKDMVARGFFSSNSPVPGKATLGDRLEIQGVTFAAAQENLQKGYFLNYNKLLNFRVVSRGSCQYTQTDRNGLPRLIERHTYLSLAQDLIKDMLDTPAQRAALLNPGADRFGIGLLPTGTLTLCGEYASSQIIVTDREG